MSELVLKKKVQVWILHLDEHGRVGRVLLFYTRPDRDLVRGSYWQPVTGSVDDGETLIQAAFREAYEESGIELPQIEALDFVFEFEGRWGRREEHVFFAKITGNLDLFEIQIDSNEHIHFEWVSVEQVSERLAFDSNRLAFSKIIKKK